MLCPKCKANYTGALANCTHCGRDLLPKKSALRSRLPALILGVIFAVVGVVPPLMFVLWPRALASFVSAFGPTLLGDRYRFRGEDLLATDPEQAIADFTKALDSMPDYIHAGRVRVLCLRAQAYDRLGRAGEAIRDIELALAIGSPQEKGATVGQVAKTIAQFPQGAVADPGDALEPWVDRIVVHPLIVGTSKDYMVALLGDLKIIESDPRAIPSEEQRAAAYALRAEALFAAGSRYNQPSRYADAEDAADTAIELDPTMGEAFRTRGYARLRTGQLDGALDDLKKATMLIRDDRITQRIRADMQRLENALQP